MLKLMYITNRPEIAKIAESAGVDRIFVDMEYIGKSDRQGGMDTVQSRHTLEDVANIRNAISTASLLVRCNPIHDATDDYSSSEAEIDGIVECGADIIMLPYFKTVAEVERFVKCVDGRAKTMLLVETPESVEIIDEILRVGGIDEIHIGLNDLSLGYSKKFMFELLTDGTVEHLCGKFKNVVQSFGFGGIASIGTGMLPCEKIIKEHYRLGSGTAILSRSFCDVEKVRNIEKIKQIFATGMKDIRDFEKECEKNDTNSAFFTDNIKEVQEIVKRIVNVG